MFNDTFWDTTDSNWSTILALLNEFIPTLHGSIDIDGEELNEMLLAKIISLKEQRNSSLWMYLKAAQKNAPAPHAGGEGWVLLCDLIREGMEPKPCDEWNK